MAELKYEFISFLSHFFFSKMNLFSIKGEKKIINTFTLVGSDMNWEYLYPESKKSWLRTGKGTGEDFLWV